jgi:hypothetical protein
VLALNLEDELVKATMLTHGGAVVHPNFGSARRLPRQLLKEAGDGQRACLEKAL